MTKRRRLKDEAEQSTRVKRRKKGDFENVYSEVGTERSSFYDIQTQCENQSPNANQSSEMQENNKKSSHVSRPRNKSTTANQVRRRRSKIHRHSQVNSESDSDDDGEQGNDEECYDEAYQEENKLGIDDEEYLSYLQSRLNFKDAYCRPVVEQKNEDYDFLQNRIEALGFTAMALDTTEPIPVSDEGWGEAVLNKSVCFKLTNPSNAITSSIKAYIGSDEFHVHTPVFRTRKKLMYFRCKCRRYHHCNASIKVDKNGVIIESSGSHVSHLQDKPRQAYWKMVNEIVLKNPHLPNDALFLESLRINKEDKICPPNFLPKKSTIKRTIYNMRSVVIPKAPNNVLDVTVDNTAFRNLKIFEKTVHYAD